MPAFEIVAIVCKGCLDKLLALSPLLQEFAICEYATDDGMEYSCSTCGVSL